jgi:hypothetical protein
MNSFLELYQADLKRYGYKAGKGKRKVLNYYLRKGQTARNLIARKYYCYRFYRIAAKLGIEISINTKIGKGLFQCRFFCL